MGIKKLHQILEKYSPGCYETKHLSCYSFKKVAIDISLYLYKYKAIAGDRWVESFISLINSLRKWDVHPVFIFDGQAPKEKIEEQKRRRESRDKQTEKIKELENQIKLFEENGIIGSLIEEICKKKVSSLFRQEVVKNYDINIAKEKLESMKSMVIHITEDDLNLMKKLFDILEIPYIKAEGEAENFASHLCIYGHVDCVLSEDTDVLAYGAPIFLTKIDTVKDTVVQITYSKILEETEMTKETFKDLCIMLECDYNSNIYMVGPEKSYSMLKTYKSIEVVLEELKKIKNKDKTPKYTDDMFEQLKYQRCRELFTTNPLNFYVKYSGIPNFKKVREFFYLNNIRFNVDRLEKTMKCRELDFKYYDIVEKNIEEYEDKDNKDEITEKNMDEEYENKDEIIEKNMSEEYENKDNKEEDIDNILEDEILEEE